MANYLTLRHGQRWQVETVNSMFKRFLGSALRAYAADRSQFPATPKRTFGVAADLALMDTAVRQTVIRVALDDIVSSWQDGRTWSSEHFTISDGA